MEMHRCTLCWQEENSCEDCREAIRKKFGREYDFTTKQKKAYVAIPYTWNPEVSYDVANKVAAALALQGYTVFSPISHGHHISDHMDEKLRTDISFWRKQNLPFIVMMDVVFVVNLADYNGDELIKKSKGVQDEINHARKLNIKVVEYKHYD